MRRLLLLALLALGAALPAADNGAKRFTKLKDDTDLYVGEGVAESKAFGGDGLKALAAARERARASLAAAIRVRIVSETSSTEKSGPDGATETVESKSASLADVVLENVRYEDFPGLPAEGQVSSLAIVSKADYRRQLAGKGPRINRPEYGLKVVVWGGTLPGIEKIEAYGTMNDPPTDAPVNYGGGGGGGSNGMTPGYGLEFVWRDFSLGADFYRKDLSLYLYDKALDRYDLKTDGITLAFASLGWQYIPWNWRVQPFVPLGLHLAHVSLFNSNGMATAASAGLGLRYWPSDAFSFEAGVRYYQGFDTVAFPDVHLRKDRTADFSFTGPQIRVAIQWSGF